MEFVGRETEMEALRTWWRSERPRPALVWGRRRVGKTALLQHFAASLDVPVVFHTGAGEALAVELQGLTEQAAAVLPDGIRSLRDRPFEGWRDALDHLAESAQDSPVLLVLDEFPELMAASRTLPGVLRAFLDHAPARTKLRILISGSAVRTVEAMREYRAPLYGRFDLALLLHGFRPREAARMLPELEPGVRALVYGITGGTPLYLSWWNQSASLAQNLELMACRPGAPLLTESELVLATEVGAGEHTKAVLSAIASGRTRHHEIADAIGADPTRTLERLTEIRLVERLTPVTEDPARTRRRIYRISDNLLAFSLGPLARYRAEIERGLGASIVSSLTRRLDDHMGAVYEEAFREHLRWEANAGRLGKDIVAIGPWWGADGQDEINALVLAEPDRARVPVLAGEVKWAKSVSAARIKARLVHKAGRVTQNPEGLRYAVCARERVENADAETLTVTSDDIFSLAD